MKLRGDVFKDLVNTVGYSQPRACAKNLNQGAVTLLRSRTNSKELSAAD